MNALKAPNFRSTATKAYKTPMLHETHAPYFTILNLISVDAYPVVFNGSFYEDCLHCGHEYKFEIQIQIQKCRRMYV